MMMSDQLLVLWTNSPRVDRYVGPLGHIIPIRTNTPLCWTFTGEGTNAYFIVFGVTRSGLEHTIYRTQGEHTNNIPIVHWYERSVCYCRCDTYIHTSVRPIFKTSKGPGGSMSQVVGSPNDSYKHITNTAWVRTRLCKLQKGCTRLTATSDKVYTSCLPMVGGSLRVLGLLPPLKLIAMIQLKYC